MIRRLRQNLAAGIASVKSKLERIKEVIRSRNGSFLFGLFIRMLLIAAAGFFLLNLFRIHRTPAGKAASPVQATGHSLLLLIPQLTGLALFLGTALWLVYRYIDRLDKAYGAKLNQLEDKAGRLEADLKKALESSERLLPTAIKKELPRKLFSQEEFPARLESFQDAVTYLREGLTLEGCRFETIRDLSTAMEELFVNVATYAYPDREGSIWIRYQVREDQVMVTLEDEGIPFNPLSHLPSAVEGFQIPEEREENGGLGLLMVHELVDNVQYEFNNGRNIVTICKAEALSLAEAM